MNTVKADALKSMNKNESQSIISVEGYGYIETAANIMQISISVSRTAQTMKQAQGEVNVIINKLITTLKSRKIDEKNIHTTSLDFGRHTEYEKGQYVYKGQKVSQRIVAFIDDLDKNIEKAIQILDDFANNDSISIDIDFSVKNDKENSIKCRELAYLNAFEKAKKYADLASLKIIKAIKISENKEPSYSNRDHIMYESSNIHNENDNAETIIPLGKIFNSITLYIDFLAE